MAADPSRLSEIETTAPVVSSSSVYSPGSGGFTSPKSSSRRPSLFRTIVNDPSTSKDAFLSYSPPPTKNGILIKESKYFHNYNERYVILQKGMLLTFDLKTNDQIGEYKLCDYSLASKPTSSDKSASNSSTPNKSGIESELSICLQRNHSAWNKDVFLHFQVIFSPFKAWKSERDAWIISFEEHIIYSNVIHKSNVDEALNFNPNEYAGSNNPAIQRLCELHQNEPNVIQGWIMKRGRIVKSWHRRYAVLHKGVLRYYVNQSQTFPFGKRQKGQIRLWNYIITTQMMQGIIYLSSDPLEVEPNISLRILLMQADSASASLSNEEWTFALKVHAQYGRQLVMSHRHVLTGRYFQSNLESEKSSLSRLSKLQAESDGDKDIPAKASTAESSKDNESDFDRADLIKVA